MSIIRISVCILMTCVLTVSGFKYKCHRDICDGSWQFCNDGEERCNTCTPEQCQPDVAKHIFNQCEEKCKSLETTSASTGTTTKSIPTTDNPLNPHPQDASMISSELLIVGCIIIVLIALLPIGFGIILYQIRQIRAQREIDSEQGSVVSYSNVRCSGEAEKQPLLEATVQISDSGLHDNKMDDIQVLADATGANVNQQDPRQPASAPPSYCTDDKLRERSQSPIACCEDQQMETMQVTREQDNDKCENMGDTNLLSSSSSKTSMDVTHLKSVD